jgi:hypothetical protein
MSEYTVTVKIKFAGGMTNVAALRWIGFRLLKLAAWVLSTHIEVEAE